MVRLPTPPNPCHVYQWAANARPWNSTAMAGNSPPCLERPECRPQGSPPLCELVELREGARAKLRLEAGLARRPLSVAKRQHHPLLIGQWPAAQWSDCQLVDGARRELSQDNTMDAGEKRLWVRALDSLQARRFEDLALVLIELGEAAEDRGHEHAARELYACAYELSLATGRAHSAVNAARFVGRVNRRRARREEAELWYHTAIRIATVAGIDHLAALCLVGLGNVHQERGNLPRTRETFDEALALAERSGHADTIVALHRAYVTLEQSMNNVDAALRHAWLAVGASASPDQRASCLASLAGALQWAADYDLAADAWNVVAGTTDDVYLRVFAYDALAHISALRGDHAGFERYARCCDGLDHETLHNAHAQILYYRGLSYRALGRLREAEEWLRRAVVFADEHRFGEVLFRAETALAGLASHTVERAETVAAAPPAVREGVRAMRRELVGAG